MGRLVNKGKDMKCPKVEGMELTRVVNYRMSRTKETGRDGDKNMVLQM